MAMGKNFFFLVTCNLTDILSGILNQSFAISSFPNLFVCCIQSIQIVFSNLQDFVSSVCDRLFEALFPGSSHPTRFSALTILGSIAEIFSVPNGERSHLCDGIEED